MPPEAGKLQRLAPGGRPRWSWTLSDSQAPTTYRSSLLLLLLLLLQPATRRLRRSRRLPQTRSRRRSLRRRLTRPSTPRPRPRRCLPRYRSWRGAARGARRQRRCSACPHPPWATCCRPTTPCGPSPGSCASRPLPSPTLRPRWPAPRWVGWRVWCIIDDLGGRHFAGIFGKRRQLHQFLSSLLT